MVVDNVKGVILLTYNLCDDITMVLVDVDDGILTANPLLIFYRGKKEIPISDIIPSIAEIEITEDLRSGGYILSLTDTAGTMISMAFPNLEFTASYLQMFVTDCVTRKIAKGISASTDSASGEKKDSPFLVPHGGNRGTELL